MSWQTLTNKERYYSRRFRLCKNLFLGMHKIYA